MNEAPQALIESLGVYLPPRSVTTKEVIDGCDRKVLLPLERLTGIKSRRMAGEVEFSIDLAIRAIEECLEYSKHAPSDIDFLISCNISKFDGPDHYSFEPSTSARLRTHFGIHHALAFDVTNACAGMFTGIYLADALIKSGAARRGIVVSGEYITHLTQTAQKEITGLADPLLACLTLGDAGAAVLIDSTKSAVTSGDHKGKTDQAVGLHAVDLYTLGRHSDLCIAKVTDKPHGGAIMNTDMIGLAKVAVTAFLQHAALTVFKLGWAPSAIHHVIPHQTSKSTLDAGTRSVQRVIAGRGIDFDGKLIVNVEERGNTATTSHFVALMDSIRNGTVKSGDGILFGILASGVTVGTAVYRLDDLPDRIRAREPQHRAATPGGRAASRKAFAFRAAQPRVRVESAAIADEDASATSDTLAMLASAGARCIEASSHSRSDIDLVLSAAVYRTEYLSEPAIASLLAGRLRINDAPRNVMEKRTFAFDVINGGLGFLEACYLASTLIGTQRAKIALVATSEVENNAGVLPDRLRGIAETGAALLLDSGGEIDAGFVAFSFRSFPEHASAISVHGEARSMQDGERYVPHLVVNQVPEIEEIYAQSAVTAVEEFLDSQELKRSDIALFVPPQISPGFVDRFCELLGVERRRCIDVSKQEGDLFTGTLPHCWLEIVKNGTVKDGDLAVIVNVAAGLEVGCATYQF